MRILLSLFLFTFSIQSFSDGHLPAEKEVLESLRHILRLEQIKIGIKSSLMRVNLELLAPTRMAVFINQKLFNLQMIGQIQGKQV